jgi:hypothetical protein
MKGEGKRTLLGLYMRVLFQRKIQEKILWRVDNILLVQNLADTRVRLRT